MPANIPSRYKHPYETEIREAQTPPSIYVKSEPIPPLPYESSAATFVDAPESVRNMLEELKEAREIAIDLEHHEEHSYIGLVSLMQISTREKDWVIDTLRPWRQDLQVLNEVFADPKIVKVFHGSKMDMIWLQRDLGLYVVGLFDTYHAAVALGYPKRSLAFLLKKYVGFDAAKQYQTADWRIRPLPEEMFNYARSDTHFLLYIYDMMRNELVEKSNPSQSNGDLIDYVIQSSKKESLQKYERPLYDEEHGTGPLGWYSMLQRTPALFNREQFAVFRAVHQWRDQVAREEDESLHTVMPKRVLYSIARETPTDMASLLGCSHPMSRAYQKRKSDLLDMVMRAKAAGAARRGMKNFLPISEYIGPHAPQDGKSLNEKNAIYDKGLASALTYLRPNIARSALMEMSAFWGPSMPITRQALDRNLHAAINNLDLALPLPELTAEVFIDTKAKIDGNKKLQIDPGSRAENQTVEEGKPKGKGVFIIRESGGPRKRKAADAEYGPDPKTNGSGRNGSNEEEPERLALEREGPETDKLRAERKRERHERKLERKRLRHEKANQIEKSGKAPGVEPFDYENAPSVLHASESKDGKTAASTSVNPYAKSLDAPKGMRKSKKESGGKSLTFTK